MDIVEVDSFNNFVEHYIFIDSNDARFTEGIDVQRFDPITNTYITYRDTVGQVKDTPGLNPINSYKISFQQPFINVVSVEIMEAYLPTTPIAAVNTYREGVDPLRYVTIRVPEIEAHMQRSKRDVNWPFGMAKICWDSIVDKDFVSYKKPFKQMRKFHPIGKLSNLTFQFYKNNTTELVKFQGFHHHMTIAITTAEPRKQTPKEFPMSPFYDPMSRSNGFVTLMISEEQDDDLEIPQA